MFFFIFPTYWALKCWTFLYGGINLNNKKKKRREWRNTNTHFKFYNKRSSFGHPLGITLPRLSSGLATVVKSNLLKCTFIVSILNVTIYEMMKKLKFGCLWGTHLVCEFALMFSRYEIVVGAKRWVWYDTPNGWFGLGSVVLWVLLTPWRRN